MFPSSASGGAEESILAFEPAETVKGSEDEGKAGRQAGRQGTCLYRGRWRFEGQSERAFVDHWASRREGREMSVIEFEKEKKKDEEEGGRSEEKGAEH